MGPWLSPRDAADYLGILSEDLPSLVRRGLLPAPSQHLGPRRPRYPQAELDRFMAGLSAPAPTNGPSPSPETADADPTAAVAKFLAQAKRRPRRRARKA